MSDLGQEYCDTNNEREDSQDLKEEKKHNDMEEG